MSDVTQDEEESYTIKRVWFGVLRVGIVTQEGNGPCPILAIANTLLLRGAIALPPNQRSISHPALVALLTSYAHEINHVPTPSETNGISVEVAANIEANLAASIRVLESRTMRYGMDINCSLTDVSAFEFTSEIGVFDLFRIRPLHGWVASPDEEELHEFFSGRSYNQVQDAIARLQQSLESTAGSTITHDEDEDEDEICAAPIRRRPSCGINSVFDTGTASQAALAGAWFAAHATQLTPYGLQCLQEAMGESEIAVLFRNNHYNTVIKHEGTLYTLVSAAGFLQCPRFVFQKVTVAGADIEAFDGSFVPLRELYPSTELLPATGPPDVFPGSSSSSQDEQNEVRPVRSIPEGAEAPAGTSDAEFAKMVAKSGETERRRHRLKQEEIDRRYAKRVQAIYDAHGSVLPNVGQTARHEPSGAFACVLM